jgi:hypothetical protein
MLDSAILLLVREAEVLVVITLLFKSLLDNILNII